ncbi:hypothetical protein LCGC14_2095460, partial [marine sediment metagenome]
FLQGINFCETNKIKCLVISQPNYYSYIYFNYTNELFQQLPEKNFLNLNNLHSTFHLQELYYDKWHLNIFGAQLFTLIIAIKFESASFNH